MEQNGKKYVPWQVFIWVASVITLAIVGSLGLAQAGMNLGQDNRVELRGQQEILKSIQESVERIEKQVSK